MDWNRTSTQNDKLPKFLSSARIETAKAERFELDMLLVSQNPCENKRRVFHVVV